jgi:hypothetical protein
MDIGHDRTGSRGPARTILAVVLGLYLVAGLTLTLLHLGDVPRYGDSHEYLKRAESLEIDPYRGIGYPALLAGIDRLVDEEPLVMAWRRRWVRPDAPRTGMGGFLLLQAVQYGALAAALAYFLRKVAGIGMTPWRRFLLGALVFVDPLVAHFQQAVLTDGLTLSACLVFCAALAELLRAPRVRWSAVALLALGLLAAANLRVEKASVLTGTALVALAAHGLLERRRGRPLPWRRAGIVLATLALCLALGRAVQKRFETAGDRWPVRDSILDQRISYPYLHTVYDDLPSEVRAQLSLEQAREHDRGIRQAREVIDEVSGEDPVRRTALIEACAGVVARQRWGALAFDIAKDTLENVLATVSFAVRTGAFLALDANTFEARFPDDWASWTHERLTMHHPRAMTAFLGLTALGLVTASLAALAALRGRRGSPPAPATGTGTWEAWIPALAFVLVNALAFAAVADLVHLRYTLLAHVAFVLIVQRGALAWLRGPTPTPPTP